MNDRKEQISASIDPTVIKAVEQLASDKKRSFSYIVNELLTEILIQKEILPNEQKA